MLDRKKLLKKELHVERVDFEDGEYVFVKEMSGTEREGFEQLLSKEIRDAQGKLERVEQNTSAFRAKLVVSTVCDEKGVLLLHPEDVQELNDNMGIQRLEKIVSATERLNGIGKQIREELIKNSEAVQTGNSSSDSAVRSE